MNIAWLRNSSCSIAWCKIITIQVITMIHLQSFYLLAIDINKHQIRFHKTKVYVFPWWCELSIPYKIEGHWKLHQIQNSHKKKKMQECLMGINVSRNLTCQSKFLTFPRKKFVWKASGTFWINGCWRQQWFSVFKHQIYFL